MLVSVQDNEDASRISTNNMNVMSVSAYMPHLSLLYANISDEQKKQAKELAEKLDEAINGLSFPITRLALYKTDTGDETLKSWEKIAEQDLPSS